MTGAYATPLDLTDFSVSARLQLGFRLTRSVARFDIVNDAATSKFTIQSVSMANGRRGVSFFPLKVTGTLPTAVLPGCPGFDCTSGIKPLNTVSVAGSINLLWLAMQ